MKSLHRTRAAHYNASKTNTDAIRIAPRLINANYVVFFDRDSGHERVIKDKPSAVLQWTLCCVSPDSGHWWTEIHTSRNNNRVGSRFVFT